MSDTPAVHWVGTGLSTGPGLAVLAEQTRVVLWGRTETKAEDCLKRLGVTGEPRAFTPEALAAEVDAGDVVVSMLPGTEHPGLLRICLDNGAHFACSSYASDAIRDGADKAAAAGLTVLTEIGLDPGIDHLFADVLVERASRALGPDARVTAAFTSYCGGVPAEPNEFRYRFSWAPRGVLTALLTPAHYVESGEKHVADRPWEVARPLELDGEQFEVYPNRDSLPYIRQYGVPEPWRLDTFVRGTLRLDGWLDAWADVFAELRRGDSDRISELADVLAARHPTRPQDRDRVVLAVELSARRADGRTWSGRYALDLVGDPGASAMARCVSLPLALGIGELLEGALPAGLVQGAPDPTAAARWLDRLAAWGLPIRLTGNDL
ncbi:saccharopine dehydrogenase NADP-binding domain-containing protein [Amycolatopsis sp. QT-25]|uniref:saccharopine dehydrogenase family protein n=1 Tax=Amycolatopsis sp. QT-25 TaxID=3034022 RepID=UPI0023EB8465|nr:saccharopine dehydrogenase family protein [Amycolatopsis sp. QT-25]WET76277.1 saccharopine dehydrogenase NADP-binding domain-containing protein [Amycolatopsis sp. QT-25]